MKRSIGIIVLLTAFVSSFAQNNPVQIDGFGRASNDELLARVDNLWNQLRDGSHGVVILTSTKLANHRNKRRIEGCNLMRRYPQDSLIFIFKKEEKDYDVEFWKLPPGPNPDPRFAATPIDYTLPELSRPLELTNSLATDDFCPVHFDLDWYSEFMSANPTFKGKAIFDTSKRDFVNRVVKYRKQLESLGINPFRVRFLRRHFFHETDEQWWLIPPGKR